MADKTFRLEIVAPNRTFYAGDAVMVELTTTEGDVGIYADHIPMTMIVAPGVLTITESSGDKKTASLISGFMEIKKDKVTVLAETAEWPDEIDLNRAKEAEKRARERLNDHSDAVNITRAEAALKRAFTRQEAAQK